ncbi:MAG: HAMP domain-containing histidine kinase [Planctomycetia bacterium]|nr:HAMP domain-containing histidine kinase [Planctomycetia bacterium]
MAGNEPAETLERLINLGHLSSGVGHHVINAFSAIVSNSELLRLKAPIATVPEPAVLAETIIRTALEAATVARRLIDYTRPVTSIEPDRAAFEPHTLSLDRLAADFVKGEQSRARPEVVWETDLNPLAPIKGHEAQLLSMLAHLVQNAYEAIPPRGGTVAISTSTDGRGWNVLEVRDSGQGMEVTTLERAVEPFFSTKPGHFGVGLSIANGIWRRHRGTLSIQSVPGEGTRIRLFVEPSQG